MSELNIYLHKIARTKTLSELTEADRLLILKEYSQIGDSKDDWIEWVLSSLKRNKCPYR